MSLREYDKKNDKELLDIAKNSFQIQIKELYSVYNQINTEFIRAIEYIANSQGRLIVSGVGKSGIIAQKLVATYNSIGIPSIFLHPTDAMHGDLGVVLRRDILLIISKSGNTQELKVMIPWIKSRGNKIICIVGNKNSYLAKHSNVVLMCKIKNEACPNNLVPTSSTTAQLVLGDTLAMVLMNKNKFTEHQFSQNHPGGSLGKQLLLKVENIIDKTCTPKVTYNSSMENVIYSISKSKYGITVVLDLSNKLVGVITDGDLRRMLSEGENFMHLCARDIMSDNPKTIQSKTLAVKALEILENSKIGQLVVLKKNSYVGILDIHDLLREIIH